MKELSFNCADIGIDCQWKIKATSEEELLQNIAKHAKTEHGVDSITPVLLNKVREAIREIPESQKHLQESVSV